MLARSFFPSHLWGGRAHRDSGATCDGWGCFRKLGISEVGSVATPHPALRATLPASGREERAAALNSKFSNSQTTHPHLRDLAARARVLIGIKRI